MPRTRTRRIACLLALGLLLGPAPTARSEGINLAWNDCGAHGTPCVSFPCNDNGAGPYRLVGSFVPPPGILEFVGLDAWLTVTSDTPTLPDWWRLNSIIDGTQCRSGMDFSLSFPSASCANPYGAVNAGAFAYGVGSGGANRAQIHVIAAQSFDLRGPLDPSREYYAFVLDLNTTRTVGAGACSGCNVGVEIVLDSIKVEQPAGIGFFDAVLTTPIVGNHAGWQSTPFCTLTPERRSTWGRIKTLYR